MQKEMLQELKDGSHKVFSIIYNDWHKKVFAYFLQKANDETTACDLTQQTFIKLWTYRRGINIDLTIDQQLFQKARQVWIDWLRKEAISRKYLSSNEYEDCKAVPQPSLENMYLNAELKQSLSLAMNALPEKRKRVFELKHIHGMSYKEIAEHLHISVKTVDNHLLKATAQLKKIFYCIVCCLPGMAIIYFFIR
ncbi:RNA polymerase sigma factor [Niabella aquatica]